MIKRWFIVLFAAFWLIGCGNTETADTDIDYSAAYAVREGDHVKGASNPDLLIVEYGDFQ